MDSPAVSSVYSELEDSNIRLLELDPALESDEPLVGRLQIHPLIDIPPYEAVSYAWGKPNFNRPIEIDGSLLQVTENLDVALRHIRLTASKRLLWIDAICINQNDIPERNHQVTMMKQIYQQCSRLLVWIGPVPTSSPRWPAKVYEEGLRVMDKISKMDIRDIKLWEENFDERHWSRQYRRLAEIAIDHEAFKPMVLSDAECRSLLWTLKSASVWRRVWIMQELSCAPHVLLLGGKESLDWAKISQFLRNQPYADAFHASFGHGQFGPMVRDIFGLVQPVEHQRRILQDTIPQTGASFLDVLSRFCYADASNSLDKIYGLLGLASDLDIKVDYTRSPKDLFIEVTSLLINAHKNLDIICQSPWQTFEDDSDGDGDGEGPGEFVEMKTGSRPKDLPSWATDFSRTFENTEGLMLFAQRSIFKAGRATCFTPCRVLDSGALYARGVILGTIGPIHKQKELGPESAKGAELYHLRGLQGSMTVRWWIEQYFGDDKLFDDPEMTYANGEPALTAFCRTLVTDRKGYPMERLSKEDIDDLVNMARGHRFIPPPDIEYWLPFVGLPALRMWDGETSWTFSMTDNGLYVMIAGSVREGDLIACVDGGKVPLVLRSNDSSDGKRYKVVSVAYVHGFMDMEAYGLGEEQDILLL